jgi:hypothetical protein
MQGAVTVTPESGGAPADSKIVTLTSLSPDRLLLSRSASAAGSPSVAIAYQANSQGSQVYLQALAGEGEAVIRISADGYADSTATVTLVPSVFRLDGISSLLLQTGTQPAQGVVRMTWTNTVGATGMVSDARMRPGAAPVAVPLTVADPSVLSVDPQVTFMPGDATKTFSVTPVAPGKTTLTLGVPPGYLDPGLNPRTAVFEVQLRQFTLNCPPEIAKDTQTYCYAAVPYDVTLTVTSSTPELALISLDPYKAGSAQVAGKGINSFYVQALADDGAVDVSLTAPGFQDAKVTYQLRPAIVVLGDAMNGLPSIPMRVGELRQLSIEVRALLPSGDPGNSGLSRRPGLAPLPLDISSSAPGVVKVGGSSPVAIMPGFTSAYVALVGVAPGNATVSVATPPGFAAPPRSQVLYVVK